MGYGLFRPAHDLSGPHEDLLAWRLVLPNSGVFTHLTAAREYGWWLPPLPDDIPVFVDMCGADPRPRRPELVVTRHPAMPAKQWRGGLPLAPPAETLLACARELGLVDLVVLIDSALHLRHCSYDDVAAAASMRRRGAPKLRSALRHADARSESAWESVLRMLHVACDVPVEPQYELYDASGMFVARGDLWIVGTRTLHEYDGAGHRERHQHRRDLRRERGIGHLGWTRRGYTSVEVTEQGITVLRDADASLRRPHRPDRIRAWHALLADSLFSGSGAARLRARWGLPPRCAEAQVADDSA